MKSIAIFCLLIFACTAINMAEDTAFQAHGIGLVLGYFEPSNARESYEAVYDSPGLRFGIIYDYAIVRSVALDVRVNYFTKSGNRVFVGSDGSVTETDINEDLTIANVTAGAKYVFFSDKNVCPYLGGGIGFWRLETSSEVDDYSKTGFGGLAFAGVRLFAQKAFSLNVEVSYSIVPDMIGSEPSSTSFFYGEDDIGGLAANCLLQYRF